MAKKHIYKYHTHMQNQYQEMLDKVNTLKDIFTKNHIDERQYFDILNQIDKLKGNYERTSYIIYLLKTDETGNMFRDYYKEIEEQFDELVEIYNEVTQDHLENKLSDEEYENIINNIHIYKEQENYVRLRYLLMLLDKPQRKNKKFNKKLQYYFDSLKHHSQEAIIEENKSILLELENLINETKVQGE